MFNSAIDFLINNQRYDGYNLNFDYLGFISNQHLLIDHHNNVTKISYPYNVNENFIERLDFLSPYLYIYFQSLPSNISVKFLMSLADVELNYLPKHIPLICFAKQYYLDYILIPNVDFFSGGFWSSIDTVNKYDSNYYNKIDGSCFTGSSTGTKDINNKRIRYCNHVKQYSNHIGKINNLCQGSKTEWSNIFPNINKILGKTISIPEQLKYKILINIDGNGPTYSRLYWQIISNCIPVYIEPNFSYKQFFDHPSIINTYYMTSIEDSYSLFDYILNNNNQKFILDKQQAGKKYYEMYFKNYFDYQQQYLMYIMKSVLDRLIFRNCKII